MVPNQDRQSVYLDIEASDPSFNDFSVDDPTLYGVAALPPTPKPAPQVLPADIIPMGGGAALMQRDPGEVPTLIGRVQVSLDTLVTDHVDTYTRDATVAEIALAALLFSFNQACGYTGRKPTQSLPVVRNDGRKARVYRTLVDDRFALFVMVIGAAGAVQLRGDNIYEALGRVGFNGEELKDRVQAGMQAKAEADKARSDRPLITLWRGEQREETRAKSRRRSPRRRNRQPVALLY